MVTKAKLAKGVVPSDPETPLPLESVSVEQADALGITADVMVKIRDAENLTRARLMAEPTRSIKVPRNITVSPSLVVNINGCRFSLPIGQTVQAPESVVRLAEIRIARAVESEEAARARSAGL